MSAWWERTAPALARVFCLTVGPFLLLDGLTGMIFAGTGLAVGPQLPHREWNWFFEFNDWHHLLHVVTGGILLVAGLRREWVATGALIFGAVYLVLTPVAVIDGDDVANLIYSDGRDNAVHGMFALEAIVLGLGARAGRADAAYAGLAPEPSSSELSPAGDSSM